ncbi:MAG TPA: hypothetical protein VK501_09505 [Baekduia sp.]|uniref:hypothetical protein n=1 Tax=Baekduia sp. TaxID=2600305 RepID=UPI002C4CC7D9|nr:hypothetical protein [Baekduia sp.]HMJ34143.1 hypothetical protein [Baekduia sp.]
MPRRIDLGRAVLFIGAALLLISLFTEWYDTGPTGWEVFESLDLVLAALALGAMLAAVRPDAVGPSAAWALPGAALAIVIVELVNAPPAAAGGDPTTGAWLALGGSFLMAAGAALSLAAISVTIQVREREVRRRVAAVDRRADRDAEAAEDLDADAGAAPGDVGADDDAVTPPRRRRSRLGPRETPAARTASAGRPDPDALERTQPLTSHPDGDPEDAERP